MTQSIKLRSRVGEDGILHLDFPIGLTDSDLEVTVTFKKVTTGTKTPEELGWEPGFFERTYGSCAADPIVIDHDGISAEVDDNVDAISIIRGSRSPQ